MADTPSTPHALSPPGQWHTPQSMVAADIAQVVCNTGGKILAERVVESAALDLDRKADKFDAHDLFSLARMCKSKRPVARSGCLDCCF